MTSPNVMAEASQAANEQESKWCSVCKVVKENMQHNLLHQKGDQGSLVVRDFVRELVFHNHNHVLRIVLQCVHDSSSDRLDRCERRNRVASGCVECSREDAR